MIKNNSALKYQMIMFLCAIFWSLGGLLIKLIPWNSFIIASGRSIIAAAILFAYMKITKKQVTLNKFSLLLGITMAAKFILFVSSNKLTTAANAIILQNTNPIFIVLLSAIIYKQHFSKREIFVVTTCSVGIILFFFDNISFEGMWGNIIALISGLLTAIMFILSSRAKTSDISISGILWGHIITAVIGLPFILTSKIEVSPIPILAILALGIFQMGIPYILYSIAIRGCRALDCSLIGMVEPILNPVWVFLIIGEVPSKLAFIGGAIVIATVTYWCALSAKLADKAKIS
ncbi:MAG: DMT family transporter [Oscillospiraceae bacterium]